MDRRSFVAAGLAAGATAVSMTASGSQAKAAGRSRTSKKGGFKLKYAPKINAFKMHAGNDPIDNIKFIADQGFRAIFDNGLMKRPLAEAKAIVKELDRQGMDLGPFVLYSDNKVKNFVSADPQVRKGLVDTMKKGVEFAKSINAKWALVVPGPFNPGLEPAYQTANVVENLRYCAEVLEPSGLVMVLEPLNPWKNHPGLFLTSIPQTYQICRAVNSPSIKMVNDLYHQQITEGNLIPNIDMAWSEIASFHLGDNPGRKEPTTGEINYKNIFKHLYNKGYDGVLCMEHGQSISGKEGEMAVINAYRECDDFQV